MTIANPNNEIGPIGAEVDEFLAPATTPAPPPAPRDEQPAPPLQSVVLGLADRPYADVADTALDPVARAIPRSLKSVLAGGWLGHSLHPALTDFPLGCWMCASVLDLVGGRAARPAATRLVALGLVSVPAVAAAGLVDWEPI